MHKKLQKASTHFTKFFSRRPLNAADTLMVLSTLALFTAIPNSSSSTSESVCIVQAFVTVSILFRVRTLCPILYFQYILQNSEIICFQTDRFLSVILILSLVTIWQYQKTRRLECILLSCRVCLTNLEVTDETLETFPYLRSTYSDSDLEIFWSGLKSKQQTKHRPSSQLFPVVEQYRN